MSKKRNGFGGSTVSQTNNEETVETVEVETVGDENQETALTVLEAEPEPIDKAEEVVRILNKLKLTNKLAEKRHALGEMAGKVNSFRELCDETTDTIVLRTGNKKAPEIPITKPDAVREVLVLLINNLQNSIAETEDEMLNVQKAA